MSGKIRKACLALAENVGLYLFVHFLVNFLLGCAVLWPIHDVAAVLDRRVVLPWGMALCLLRLARAKDDGVKRPEIVLFALLTAWIAIPFAVRFGVSEVTMSSFTNALCTLLGVYALTTEADAAKRERWLDTASWLFACAAFVLGSLLLACAWRGSSLDNGLQDNVRSFGLCYRQLATPVLCAGLYYNSSALVSLTCALMTLPGIFRRKNKLAKAFHVLSLAMIALTVVLTQSRTCIISLLAALGLTLGGVLAARSGVKSIIAKSAVCALATALVVVGGFVGSMGITNAALAHYAKVNQMRQMGAAPALPLMATALAEEDSQAGSAAETIETETQKARGLDGIADISGRKVIWQAMLRLWREDPTTFVIGRGVYRTAHYLFPELQYVTTVDNAYLAFTADYGLIALLLLLAAIACLLPHIARAFFANGAKAGDQSVIAGAAAVLMTGIMENAALSLAHPISLALFFLLALAAANARDAGL